MLFSIIWWRVRKFFKSN